MAWPTPTLLRAGLCTPAGLQSQWESWSSEVTWRIASRSDSPDRLVIPSPPDETLLSVVLARCEMGNLRVAPAPNRPSIGESLGPIGLIVRWLLRAESMPLALISGMLGFVLFGSAISPPEATSPPMSSASPERVAPQESSEPLPPAPPRTETPQQPSHPP